MFYSTEALKRKRLKQLSEEEGKRRKLGEETDSDNETKLETGSEGDSQRDSGSEERRSGYNCIVKGCRASVNKSKYYPNKQQPTVHVKVCSVHLKVDPTAKCKLCNDENNGDCGDYEEFCKVCVRQCDIQVDVWRAIGYRRKIPFLYMQPIKHATPITNRITSKNYRSSITSTRTATTSSTSPSTSPSTPPTNPPANPPSNPPSNSTTTSTSQESADQLKAGVQSYSNLRQKFSFYISKLLPAKPQQATHQSPFPESPPLPQPVPSLHIPFPHLPASPSSSQPPKSNHSFGPQKTTKRLPPHSTPSTPIPSHPLSSPFFPYSYPALRLPSSSSQSSQASYTNSPRSVSELDEISSSYQNLILMLQMRQRKLEADKRAMEEERKDVEEKRQDLEEEKRRRQQDNEAGEKQQEKLRTEIMVLRRRLEEAKGENAILKSENTNVNKRVATLEKEKHDHQCSVYATDLQKFFKFKELSKHPDMQGLSCGRFRELMAAKLGCTEIICRDMLTWVNCFREAPLALAYLHERCSLVNEKSKITMRKCGGPEFRALSDNDKVLALKMTESGDITSQASFASTCEELYSRSRQRLALTTATKSATAIPSDLVAEVEAMHAMITSGDLDSPDSYKPHAVVLNLIARLEGKPTSGSTPIWPMRSPPAFA